jgi:hypothetical protein
MVRVEFLARKQLEGATVAAAFSSAAQVATSSARACALARLLLLALGSTETSAEPQ